MKGGKLPKGWKFMGVPQKTIVLTCGIGERYCPGSGEQDPRDELLLPPPLPAADAEEPVPEMTGEDLKLSGTRQDFGTNGEPIVLMEFTDKGADKFHDVTKDIVNSSRLKSSQGRGEALDSFAIVLDGRIKSAPTVDPDENPDGISGRQRRPDHGHRRRRRGEGPGARPPDRCAADRVVQVDRTQVSATLGKDSLNEALKQRPPLA